MVCQFRTISKDTRLPKKMVCYLLLEDILVEKSAFGDVAETKGEKNLKKKK